MKAKKVANTVFEELIANGVGWIAGLLSVDVVKMFFIEKKWYNAWGIFSKKSAVDSDTFAILEWAATALIGFLVMFLINMLIKKVIFRKKEIPETQAQSQV
jgi:hypothetical protein